jgi:hypothetical protein
VTRRSFLVGPRAAFRSVTCNSDGTPPDLITYGLKFIYRMYRSTIKRNCICLKFRVTATATKLTNLHSSTTRT